MLISRLPFWPTVVSALATGVLLALGVWQLQRLQVKNALIATINERIDAPAAVIPARSTWKGLDVAALAYRRVSARGRFDHGRELHVFTHLPKPKGPHGGSGYWIVTPFILDGGGSVLVNRGFVPQENRAPSTRIAGQVEGTVTLSGIVRQSQRRGPFTPRDEPEKNLWFTRDAAAMARYLKLPANAPFLIDADASSPPGGLPQGGETRLRIANQHLQYALTWFALAACLIGVYIVYSWPRVRARRKSEGR